MTRRTVTETSPGAIVAKFVGMSSRKLNDVTSGWLSSVSMSGIGIVTV